MMFPKPMRLEPWVAFDGALTVEVVDALAEQDAGDGDSDAAAEDSGDSGADGAFAPMAAAAQGEPSGTNEITGTIPSLQNDSDPSNNNYEYELELPYGVTIPDDGDGEPEVFLPFYDETELELAGGLEHNVHNLYFTVSDPANGTFDFYTYNDLNGKSLPGFKEGDLLFAKTLSQSQSYISLALFRCDADGEFQPEYNFNWRAICQKGYDGGVRFVVTASDNWDWSNSIDATTQAELMFRSLVFTPGAGAEAGDSIGKFDVGIYYQETEPDSHVHLTQSGWNEATASDNKVVLVEDASVKSNTDGSIYEPPEISEPPPPPPPPPPPETGTEPGTGDESGSGGESGSGTAPGTGSEPEPEPTPTPDPTPEPDPEPEPTPVEVVPEVPPPVPPPPQADAGSGGDSGSAGDAPAAEAGGDAPGSESGAESAESGDAGDAMGADDLVYIQQREADGADDVAAAAASNQQRREDAAVEAVPVTVEALSVEAAAMFELARDMENLLGSARSDRAGLEEILLRLRDEYLARPGDDWGEGRNVLRRLFDFGNAEMTAINRVIAELTRQMDDFDSLSAARRDGMVMESLRELALSVERRSGETGAITRALAEVVEALSAARAAGREIDSAAVAALYERVYAQEMEVWAAKAQRADAMGRELAAAAREFARN